MTDELRSRIAQLSPEKRALLERKLMQMRPAGADAIGLRDRTVACPLSFPQQRLWFLDQWDPGAPTYNAALAMRVVGPLDEHRLERAIAMVIERHEALRTVLVERDGIPVQELLEPWFFELAHVDLRDPLGAGELPERPPAVDLADRLREASRWPFDLTSDLMLRVTVFQLDDDERCLLFQEHHVAFDGWSDAILFDELEAIYPALPSRSTVDGPSPTGAAVIGVLPVLPIQYGDFAAWQRGRLDDGTLDDQIEYWTNELGDAPTRLELPTDLPRPAVQTFAGRHLPIALPRELAEGVVGLSRAESATPYQSLLAAFALSLYRFSGADEVLVGTPIANRGRPETEHLIGFFANTLVMRVDLRGNPSFRELIARVRRCALGAYAHQDVPFEKIVEALNPMRHPGFNPLFQVNFRVQPSAPRSLALPGLEIRPVEVDIGFARFDLALELQLGDTGIGGYFEYNEQLFVPATIERLGASFETLLTDAVADPDRPILALEFPPVRAARRARSIAAAGASRRTSQPHEAGERCLPDRQPEPEVSR